MNSEKRGRLITALVVSAFFCVFALSSCKKDGVQSDLRVTKISDAAGRAEFSFELEAYLNAEAIRNTDTARSVVRLKEHETVSVTLYL